MRCTAAFPGQGLTHGSHRTEVFSQAAHGRLTKEMIVRSLPGRPHARSVRLARSCPDDHFVAHVHALNRGLAGELIQLMKGPFG